MDLDPTMLTLQEQDDLLATLRKYQHLIPKSSRDYVEGRTMYIGVLDIGLTKITREIAEIAQTLNNCLRSHVPSFRWTTIVINWNTRSRKHVDGKNDGSSFILSLGNHTGGGLRLYESTDYPDKPTKILTIHGRFTEFNGRIPHDNAPYEGERFSIIFFVHRAFRRFSGVVEKNTLESLLPSASRGPRPPGSPARSRTRTPTPSPCSWRSRGAA